MMSFQDFQRQAQGGAPQGVGIGQMTVQMLQQRMRQLQQQQMAQASQSLQGPGAMAPQRTDFNPNPGPSSPGMTSPGVTSQVPPWAIGQAPPGVAPGGVAQSLDGIPNPATQMLMDMARYHNVSGDPTQPPSTGGGYVAPGGQAMPPNGAPPPGSLLGQGGDPEYQRGLQLGALLRAMQLG